MHSKNVQVGAVITAVVTGGASRKSRGGAMAEKTEPDEARTASLFITVVIPRDGRAPMLFNSRSVPLTAERIEELRQLVDETHGGGTLSQRR